MSSNKQRMCARITAHSSLMHLLHTANTAHSHYKDTTDSYCNQKIRYMKIHNRIYIGKRCRTENCSTQNIRKNCPDWKYKESENHQ